MNAVDVLFVGGPADGEISAVPSEPDGKPPTSYKVVEAPTFPADPMAEFIVPREREYRREVNPSDDGPLWIYRMST